MKHIIIVGFMGSGKSTVGRILAEYMKLPYISTDALIETDSGKKISEIFSGEGEEHFRKLEHDVLKKSLQRPPCLIDTGGGIMTRAENVRLMKDSGTIICLQAPFDVMWRRIEKSPHRPLLATDNPKEKMAALLKERQKGYAAADYFIETAEKTPRQIAESIRELLADD